MLATSSNFTRKLVFLSFSSLFIRMMWAIHKLQKKPSSDERVGTRISERAKSVELCHIHESGTRRMSLAFQSLLDPSSLADGLYNASLFHQPSMRRTSPGTQQVSPESYSGAMPEEIPRRVCTGRRLGSADLLPDREGNAYSGDSLPRNFGAR